MSVRDRVLSPRQQSILQFVQQYLDQQGHPPSLREIGQAVGISSSSNVKYHVNRLVEQGYLGKQPGANRTLVVLDRGQQPTGGVDFPDVEAELAALRLENRRLRAWCRQLERERAWERQQLEAVQLG